MPPVAVVHPLAMSRIEQWLVFALVVLYEEEGYGPLDAVATVVVTVVEHCCCCCYWKDPAVLPYSHRFVSTKDWMAANGYCNDG